MENLNWWEDFYDDTLGDVTLTSATESIYDFMSKLLPETAKLTVFDQCCGKGYLTKEFAKHGYSALGIDASKSFIDFANKNFASENCRFVHGNAKTFLAPEPFDIAINWNTSFAYDEDDEENFKMLKAFSDNLKTGGHFFISTLNPDFVKLHFEKYIDHSFEQDGQLIKCVKESFIEGNMLKSYWHVEFPGGKNVTKFGQIKMYSIDELNMALLRYNLFIENVYSNINFKNLSSDYGSMIIYGRKYEVRQ